MHKPRMHPYEIDCLATLHQLRYLSTEQIRQRWHRGKSKAACQARLSRLRAYGILKRVRVVDHPDFPYAWRLADDGLKLLARHLKRRFARYDDVKTTFLIHLLQTNAVYLALRPSEATLSSTPFHWTCSNDARVRYFRAENHPENGTLERRKKLLAPDAILVQKGRHRSRTFIELDRSTEAIKSSTGRTSIEGKLEAYQRVLTTKNPSNGKTWYASHFGDALPSQVLFVVQPSPHDWKRHDAILKMAKAFPEVPVKVRSLNDPLGIAEDVGLEDCVPFQQSASLDAEDILRLRKLLLAGLNASAKLPFNSSERQRFELATVQCIPTLSRLGFAA